MGVSAAATPIVERWAIIKCMYASQSRTDCNFVNCATLGEYTVQAHVQVCMYLHVHVHVHGRQHMPITCTHGTYMEVHKDDSEPKKYLTLSAHVQ